MLIWCDWDACRLNNFLLKTSQNARKFLLPDDWHALKATLLSLKMQAWQTYSAQAMFPSGLSITKGCLHQVKERFWTCPNMMLVHTWDEKLPYAGLTSALAILEASLPFRSIIKVITGQGVSALCKTSYRKSPAAVCHVNDLKPLKADAVSTISTLPYGVCIRTSVAQCFALLEHHSSVLFLAGLKAQRGKNATHGCGRSGHAEPPTGPSNTLRHPCRNAMGATLMTGSLPC